MSPQQNLKTVFDKLLLIGRPAGMEQFVIAALHCGQSLSLFPTVDCAASSGMQADLIIVLQHWSDEYASDDIRQLLETFPLTRIIVVQGPWCASDRRTRQAWPASLCVPVEAAEKRLARELEVLAGKRSPLPWTAGLDEIFAFDHGEREM